MNISSLSGPNFYPKGYHSLVEAFECNGGYGEEIKPFPSLIHEEPPTWKKMLAVAKETFFQILKQFDHYFKVIIKVTKTILKAIVLAYSETAEKVGKAIAYLGLASIINACFKVKSLYKNSKDMEHSIKIKDTEGIVWSSLDILANPLKIASNLLSFAKSLDKLIRITWIALFSIVALPLTIALLAYDTIKSLYSTIVSAIELSHLPKQANSSRRNPADLRAYLEKKLGVTEEESTKIEKEVQNEYKIVFEQFKKNDPRIIYRPNLSSSCQSERQDSSSGSGSERLDSCSSSERMDSSSEGIQSIEREASKEYERRIVLLKDRKINILSRRTDKKIVNYMINVKKFLDENPGDLKTAESSLKDIKKLMVRKLTLNSTDSLFCIAEVIMLIVSSIIPGLHAAVPLTLSSCNTAFSIFKDIYQSTAMVKGLNHPEFLRAQ